jgi:phospholipase/carboxylesterase
MMNRILTGSTDAAPARNRKPDIRRAMLETSPENAPHTLFAPLHYEPGYAYPLIVWMHGPGDNETQLKQIMPLVSMRNYVGVAPRGTLALAGECDDGTRFAWDEGDEQVMHAQQRVVECVRRAARTYHLHPQRVFIAGYDCGGTMAFRIGLNRPDLFAGILSIGGAFPRGNRPLLRFNQCRDLPLFLAHGRDSRQYSADCVCEDLRLFHTAGMSVTLRQYPCGHDITKQMLSDMDAWIMEQVTGVESLPGEFSLQPPAEAN